jgi:hypothetical protein
MPYVLLINATNDLSEKVSDNSESHQPEVPCFRKTPLELNKFSAMSQRNETRVVSLPRIDLKAQTLTDDSPIRSHILGQFQRGHRLFRRSQEIRKTEI